MEPTLIWILVAVLGGFVLGAAARPGARPGAARAEGRASPSGKSARSGISGKAGTPTMGGIVFILAVALVHRHRLACHARDRRL